MEEWGGGDWRELEGSGSESVVRRARERQGRVWDQKESVFVVGEGSEGSDQPSQSVGLKNARRSERMAGAREEDLVFVRGKSEGGWIP
jgi:hypothetical protein